MATKSRATRGGGYVCKVGNFDIRHKITTPRKSKNLKGDDIIAPGSVEASVYKGRNLLKGGFNDHTKAIQYAWSMIKSSKLQHIVSKKVITKYNLVS
jgi:hypothetical protein|tara:strand:- start:3231 stop:3521 length:291 start_codon:yes stop_codon:yes gene_type:complete